MNAPDKLRKRLASGKFFVAPGCHDMIAATILKQCGFDFAYGSGYWMMASAYGLPDAGIATYSQMVERIAMLVRNLEGIAVIADADTGYGGLLNVHHTVKGYEEAGVAALQLEDQEFPKKCGHTKNKRVVSTEEMVRRIGVAIEARSSETGPVIIARSDARQGEGVESMLRRLEAYARAGAEVLFPEALVDEEEMHFVAQRLDKPLIANMADGGDTRILPATVLAEIGYACAIFPALSSLSSAAAMEKAFSVLQETGTSINPNVPLFSFSTFCKLIGFEDVWAFEERWQQPNL
jgi:2-methylisocitrate lyase-like PEP mutase family enzyme